MFSHHRNVNRLLYNTANATLQLHFEPFACVVLLRCGDFFEQDRTLTRSAVTLGEAAQLCRPNHTTPTPHCSHTTECELLLHQHFIRRLNKEKESYKARPLCLHRHVESASEMLHRPLLSTWNDSLYLIYLVWRGIVLWFDTDVCGAMSSRCWSCVNEPTSD